jgi:peptidoglycan/LPS O-acetylase OafA/YrhL
LTARAGATAGAGRISSLDGLRAVSIAYVVIAHVFGDGGPEPTALPLAFLAPLGTLGVRIFFVISGFLITTLLVREQAAVGRISLTGFYARRTLRIFPACYLYVAVVAILSAFQVLVLKPHDLAFATTYTMSYAPSPSWWVLHLWSLSCEEQFYLLWPGVLALGGRRWAERAAWAAIVGPPLFRVAWWMVFATPLAVGRSFPAVDALATGCLCALRQDDWAPVTRRWRDGYLWILATAAVALILFPQDVLPRFAGRVVRFAFNTLLNAVIAGWMLGSVTSVARGPMTRLLNTAPLIRLGVLSYSLYLWQQLFVGFRGLGSVVVIAASLAAALCSYSLVEGPLLRLRGRLRPTAALQAAAPS